MNLYRIRARFKCRGFVCSTYEHVQANDAAQAVKKGLARVIDNEDLPAVEQLTFISAFLVRKMEDL